MAITLEQLRNEALTSIHGRRLGLDQDSALVGVTDVRKAVTAATSATTATAIPNYGLTTIAAATGATWVMAAPAPGLSKELVTSTTSTGTMIITLASGSFVSTGGTSATAITFNGVGDRATLTGLTTASFAVTSLVGTST